MVEYKSGDWLKHKHLKHLYEIIAIIPSLGHCGPDRCIMIRRHPFCTGSLYNEAINIIDQDFELAPTAQILYSK